jgi:hypothetical protein
MSSSDALSVQMTMQQFAQLCDQVALGLVRKCEPHGWGKIHQLPPLGPDDPVVASVYQAAHEHLSRSTRVRPVKYGKKLSKNPV